MNHIYSPVQPLHTVSVPYLQYRYDEQPFFAYPERQGWTAQSLLDAIDSFDCEQVLARNTVQDACLFFQELISRTEARSAPADCRIRDDAILKCLSEVMTMLEALNEELLYLLQKLGTMRAIQGDATEEEVQDFYNQHVHASQARGTKQMDKGTLQQSFRAFTQTKDETTLTLHDAMLYTLATYGQVQDHPKLDPKFEMWSEPWVRLVKVAAFLPPDASDMSEASLQRCEGNLERFCYALSKHWPPQTLDIHNANMSNALGVLQSWLFFGLLHEFSRIAGLEIDLSAYVDDEESMLVTGLLAEHLDSIKRMEEAKDNDVQTKNLQHMIQVTQVACQCIRSLEDSRMARNPASNVTFAIQMLVYTIRVALERTYSTRVDPLIFWHSDFIRRKCIESHWCPFQVAALQDLYMPWTQLYAYMLGPGPTAETRDHRKCSSTVCVANQLDEATYKTAHLCSDEQCLEYGQTLYYRLSKSAARARGVMISNYWPSHPTKVQDIVRDGGIPLIAVPVDMLFTSDIRPDIVPYAVDMQYVALSHVWADGRGNPVQNSLPLCQISALCDLVARTHSTLPPDFVYFWIDTICLPLQPTPLRTFAIASMSKVYQQAAAVLVLDNDLIMTTTIDTLPSTADEAMEVLTRISLSNWSRRLWTYQEAVLAQRIFFAMSNDLVVSILDLLALSNSRTVGKLRNPNQTFDLCDDGFSCMMSVHENLPWIVLMAQRKDQPSWARFGLMWSGLPWRGTSRESDQFVCISMLLGLDATTLKDVIKKSQHGFEEPMKLVLTMQSEFPSNILFSPVDRMKSDGFRWAPKNFIGHTRTLARVARSLDETAPARLTPRGLLLDTPGVLLAPSVGSRPDLSKSHFVVDMMQDASVKSLLGESSGLPHAMMGTLVGPVEQLTQGIDILDTRDWAVMLSSPLQSLIGHSRSSSGFMYAALVAVNEAAGETMYVEYLALVRLMPVTTNVESEAAAVYTKTDTSRDLTPFFSRRLTSESQTWCVG